MPEPANAFAGAVNAAFEPLERGKKGVMFTINLAAHELIRMKQTVAERSDQLRVMASKLDRFESGATAVGKTESRADKWYRGWSASFDGVSPNIAKWYKKCRCVRD
jgi:hypothetical protein